MSVDVGRLFEPVEERILGLAEGAAALLGGGARVTAADLGVTYDFVGDGYAQPTRECLEAIRLLAATEGIVCDPVYSGKALAAVARSRATAPSSSGTRAVRSPCSPPSTRRRWRGSDLTRVTRVNSHRGAQCRTGDVLRLAGDLVVAEPHERDAGECELRIAEAILSETARGPVPAVGIGLDDERRMRPVEIAYSPRYDHVRGRARDPVRVAELDAHRFEPAPHVDRARREPAEHLPQCRRSVLSGASAHEVFEVGEVEVLLFGLVDDLLELHPAKAGGSEVEHRACRRGDRQAVERRDVGGGQRTAAVKADARASPDAPGAADADMDDRRV